MIDAKNFITNTQNILIDLLNPQNVDEQKQAIAPSTAEQAVQQVDYKKHIIVFALAFFFFVMVKNAWLSDDAYITLRTVYNFIHGYGLTWNVGERVQTYTHPLWMFLL